MGNVVKPLSAAKVREGLELAKPMAPADSHIIRLLEGIVLRDELKFKCEIMAIGKAEEALARFINR